MKSTLHRFAAKALPAAPLALAAIPAANAQIVYTDPDDMTLSASGGQIFIDMGASGLGGSIGTSIFFPQTKDFELNFGIYTDPDRPVIVSSFSLIPEISIHRTTGYWATRFSLNTSITLTSGNIYASLNYDGGNNANWMAGSGPGYLGVSFIAGTSNGGSPVVGWVRVSYNADQTITLYDFAYNASGGPILAGQTVSAIPEPSTYAAIAGLLAGSAALYRRRQQKQAAA